MDHFEIIGCVLVGCALAGLLSTLLQGIQYVTLDDVFKTLTAVGCILPPMIFLAINMHILLEISETGSLWYLLDMSGQPILFIPIIVLGLYQIITSIIKVKCSNGV